MKVTVLPSKACGVVTAPPSKSMAHRALICGALSKRSVIRNVAYSQDIEATLRCLQAMGASVIRDGDTVTIGGMNPAIIPGNTQLDCGESGSTLRFLLPLCLLANQPITLCGSGRLMERPLCVYEDLCREQGMTFSRGDGEVTVCGRLRAGEYTIPGDVSSQFVTGMLLALSRLEENSTLNIDGKFESASYVNLTIEAMNAFGVTVDREENVFFIQGGQSYADREYTVEGDCSNVAFLDAFNLLGGDVKVSGLSGETAQGDWVYRDFYQKFDDEDRCFDLSDCPDLGPVMFALAGALGGAKFVGTARLRIKESDRVAVMVEELAKFGIQSSIEENAVEIHKGKLRKPTEILCGHNDHRIVMALSLLCSVVGGTIDGAEAVAKSYPDYFSVIRSLGIEVNSDDDAPFYRSPSAI